MTEVQTSITGPTKVMGQSNEYRCRFYIRYQYMKRNATMYCGGGNPTSKNPAIPVVVFGPTTQMHVEPFLYILVSAFLYTALVLAYKKNCNNNNRFRHEQRTLFLPPPSSIVSSIGISCGVLRIPYSRSPRRIDRYDSVRM